MSDGFTKNLVDYLLGNPTIAALGACVWFCFPYTAYIWGTNSGVFASSTGNLALLSLAAAPIPVGVAAIGFFWFGWSKRVLYWNTLLSGFTVAISITIALSKPL